MESLDDDVADEVEVEPEPEIHIQDELPVTLPHSASPPPPPASSRKKKKPKKERKDAPVLSKEKVDDWEKVSDIYNGAVMDDYKWSQTINDIDVRITVPDGTVAKNVKIDIRSDHLKVELLRPTPTVRCMLVC